MKIHNQKGTKKNTMMNRIIQAASSLLIFAGSIGTAVSSISLADPMGFAQALHLIVSSAAITGYPIDSQCQHLTFPLCSSNSNFKPPSYSNFFDKNLNDYLGF